jgi:O-antigen ligase
MSVAWSDYPGVAIKRWVKATGDVIMALVVVTDPQPIAALRRLFSRVGFVLLPASVLAIKYYPHLSRAYDQWTGQQYLTGVATDKNMLGISTFVLSLGAFWQILRLWRNSGEPNRSRRLLAQGALLGFGIWLLSAANSVTSTACFTLAAGLLLVTGWRQFRGHPRPVHALVLTLVLLAGLIKLTGADVAVVHAMGRKSNLTGRANEIWPLVISMAPNPLVGAGFESFWLGPRLLKVWKALPNLYVNEAHNGYIEVYLNLGWIGLILIGLIVVHGYRRAVGAFRIDPDSACLMLAYILSAVLYSYTEAGFRMLDWAWGFLLLTTIGASQISKSTAERQELRRGINSTD